MEVANFANLKAFNSFGIAVQADFLVTIEQESDLINFFSQDWWHGMPLLVLGGGSNILFTKPFEGVVLKIDIKGKAFSEFPDYVVCQAKAGENWHDFVLFTVENGWHGLENLSLIPGSVGACPIQNIGAYGEEVKNSLFEVRYFDTVEKVFKTLANAECQFGYRDSIFKHELKGRSIITEVVFKLKKKGELNLKYGDVAQIVESFGGEPDPKKVSDAVIQIRKSKLPDPKKLGNAGSFFKNPEIERSLFEELKANFPELPSYPTSQENMVKVPAGWLIEKAGWKGFRNGDVGVHQKQALVLVNYGNAKGEEILNLAHDIIADVAEKFKITLQPEVNVL